MSFVLARRGQQQTDGRRQLLTAHHAQHRLRTRRTPQRRHSRVVCHQGLTVAKHGLHRRAGFDVQAHFERPTQATQTNARMQIPRNDTAARPERRTGIVDDIVAGTDFETIRQAHNVLQTMGIHPIEAIAIGATAFVDHFRS